MFLLVFFFFFLFGNCSVNYFPCICKVVFSQRLSANIDYDFLFHLKFYGSLPDG